MGVKVGVGNDVAVAVGLGGTVAVTEAAGVAEATGMLVGNGDGIDCDVQAPKRQAKTTETMSAFMGAIMAETRPCVNATNTGASLIARLHPQRNVVQSKNASRLRELA